MPTPTSQLQGKKILVLATEDWFVVSHFLPLLDALVDTGAEVVVATRVSEHAEQIRNRRGKLIEFDYARGPVRPATELGVVYRLIKLLRQEKPDAIHAIALKPITASLLASRMSPRCLRCFHLTGVGLTGTSPKGMTGKVYTAAMTMLARTLNGKDAHLFVENPDDIERLQNHSAFPQTNVTLLGGAGVDADVFDEQPLPSSDTVKIGFAGRMLWSKGVDVLVDAVQQVQADGVPVKLELCGAADTMNPRRIEAETLEVWNRQDGIVWHGHVKNIAAFWQGIDIAVIPSRGGEGLPRALLEAAASARPIITTDVPGCRHFVRDGVEGRIVPPDDAAALAVALRELASSKSQREQMACAARARVLDGFTERHIISTLKTTYERLLLK